ncbi:MAG: tetratricopeptide repeat protein [Elusimicrobiota bacterium]|nr:tetratricopeptide repeat protein [Elusimicrobiota bacterium]
MKKTNFLVGMLTGVVVCLSIVIVVGWLLFERYEKSRQQQPAPRQTDARRESIADYLPALTAAKTPADMLAALDKIIALRPNDAAAHAAKGDLLAELGDYAGALRAYDTALALEPSNAQFYFSRAIPKFMLGDYAGAASDLGFAVRLNPQMAQAYYNRGVANMNMLQIPPAALDFARARDLFASFGDAAGARDAASALRRADNYLASSKQAARGKKRGGNAASGNASAQKPAQTLAIKRGDETAAKRREQLISSLNAAIEGPKGALEKFKANAAVNLKGDMPAPDDFAAYDAALRKTVADSRGKAPAAPQNTLDYMSSAKKKSAAGDYKGAVSDIDKAIAMSPDNAALYEQRAAFNEKQGDAAHAIKDLTKALELAPENAAARAARAKLRSDMGDIKGALEDIGKAKELYAAQGKQKEYDEAKRQEDELRENQRMITKRMVKDRELVELNDQANAAFENKNFKKAEELYKKLLEKEPNNSGFAYNLAATQANQGKYKEALENTDKSIKNNPNFIDAPILKSKLQEILGDHDGAQKTLDDAGNRVGGADNQKLQAAQEEKIQRENEIKNAKQILLEASGALDNKNYQQAEQKGKEFTEKYPNAPNGWLLLAQSQGAQGKLDDAYENALKGSKLAKGSELEGPALELLEEIEKIRNAQ